MGREGRRKSDEGKVRVTEQGEENTKGHKGGTKSSTPVGLNEAVSDKLHNSNYTERRRKEEIRK